MIDVIYYRRTCTACPSQWEGVCSDGRTIYIRYRHGSLTWGTGVDIETAVDDSFNCEELHFEDDLSGYMTDDEMINIMLGLGVRFAEALGDRGETN